MNAKLFSGRWVLVGMLLLGVLSACAPQVVAAPPAANMDTITVTGIGSATGAPDMGSIQLGMSVTNQSIDQAMSETNAVIEKITAALTALGVAPSDIQTTNFSIWPEERYDPNTGLRLEEKYYRVENMITVVVRNVEQMPQVVVAGLENGANNMFGMGFSIAENDAYSAEARAAAIADARVRAEQIAAELGVTLGEPRIAREQYSSGFVPMAEAALGMGGGGAPPISEGSLRITIQVDVTFDIIR